MEAKIINDEYAEKELISFIQEITDMDDLACLYSTFLGHPDDVEAPIVIRREGEGEGCWVESDPYKHGQRYKGN